jgi:uncharacterized protein YbgA (DUF1722 family)/uncharacterized protein YbbK (DUF523 family)
MPKPKIVLSSCFLKPNRYNGEIVHNDFIEKLKPYIDYIDYCPEVDIGLGIPRPRIIIIEDEKGKRLIQPETGRDLTEKMNEYVNNVIKGLNNIEGFILKAKSPSCGVSSAKVYKNGIIIGKTDGFFASAIKEIFPYLPIEDEGRLRNEEIRKHFLTRIFAFSEFRDLTNNPSIKKLVEFHSKYKYLLMTYSQKNLKELGKTVADGRMSLKEKLSNYKNLFYQAFMRKPSPRRHVNTLNHLAGHISKQLSQKEKRHLFNLIDKYSKGLVEIRVILELLRNLSFRFENQYILIQKYLDPFPEELNIQTGVRS